MSVISILIAIIIFGLLIFFHELGHFLMAKICGIGVIEFSIGMGPRIISKQGKNTRYSLKAIPFGGSCAMVGEDAAGGGEISFGDDTEDEQREEPENSFNKKSVWARMLTIIGGPLFNFILAFILGVILCICVGTNDPIVYNVQEGTAAASAGIQKGDRVLEINGHTISMGADISLVLMGYPLEDDTTVLVERDGKEIEVKYNSSYTSYITGITYMATDEPAELSTVNVDSPAQKAGLASGDIIVGVNGTKVNSGEEFALYMAEHPLDGSEVTFTYSRGGAEFEAKVTPEKTSGNKLGFSATNYHEDATFVTAITGGFKEVGYGVRAVLVSLKMLFNGQASVKDLSGPVGIVDVISKTVTTSARDGVFYVAVNMMSLSVLLSANLGFVNMLPFPALDGGRFLLLVVEAITKKRLPSKVENIINAVGFCLLILLMIFIMYSDITKLF